MQQFDPQAFRWIIPAALAIVLLLQLLVLAFLSRVPREREPRQPSGPILPPVRDYNPPPGMDFRPPPPGLQNPPNIPPPPAAQIQEMPPQPLASLRTTQTAPAASSPLSSAPSAPPPAPAARSSGGVGKFIVLAGLDSVAEIPFPAKEFAIGRFYSPENDILVGLDEKSVSRKHARFIADESIREYYLKDTSSSFGTFILVNGKFEQIPAHTQERVYNEDVVRFGNVVTVRLLLPAETRSAVTNL